MSDCTPESGTPNHPEPRSPATDQSHSDSDLHSKASLPRKTRKAQRVRSRRKSRRQGRQSLEVDYFQDIPGSMPGTLRVKSDAPPEITLIDYNDFGCVRAEMTNPVDIIPYIDTESVSWIDLQGIGNEAILQQVGQVFELHPLMLEDVVNVPQRPKVEEYDDQLLLIARMVRCQTHSDSFITEQVSFILGDNYLLTVQEIPAHDCFSPVRARILAAKGSIRRMGADYLLYTLFDAIIDGFFPVLESYGERLEILEDEVVTNPSRQTLEKIHRMKRELLTLRRSIWPQRDALSSLIRDSSELISDDVRIYLRDCYDHTVQVLDMVETYREVASSLMDVYLSSVGNKMNEIMKFLTIVSSIFIPLSFIAGVYGMNFENMPELKHRLAYFICWGVMIGIAGSLMLFFWRKGWFENYSTIVKRRD
ncbi:magnesium/cobalt transporter CorA [filamentous cyanobacterium LEGE 11480]|uniref:Magnesium transport protein CorA n=1 Tax=Romeriopsis navalis LEGE 11480 TaxID=2777977 RepID=A0A928Z504_9CYAN|nr:magnesium/cobalt transporter CorA [Romeriopsis navalis]MBE9030740.1 magnesium/cobalt transporter CorA [Romeriopsis navalis LEGE 11480]